MALHPYYNNYISLPVGGSQCAVRVYPSQPPGLGSFGIRLGCGLVGSAE